MSRWYVLPRLPYPQQYISSVLIMKYRSLQLTLQLFFDDETPNYEVEDLGLTMQLVPKSGFDLGVFEEGVKLWRKRNGITIIH